MRWLCAIVLSLICLTTSANIEVFDTIPAHATTATMTVRARGPHWGIVWNRTDSVHYDMAWFTEIPDVRQVDPAFPQPAMLVISSVRDSIINESEPIMVPCVDTGTIGTLKIVYDGYSARLYAGADKLQQIEAPQIITDLPTQVAYIADEVTRIDRADALYFAMPTIAKSQWPDVKSLLIHIEDSTDPLEAVWEYMDRNITAPTTLGGKYTLATVRDGDDYNIIYLKGNTTGDWEPLDIKGTLSPTIFVGNYDMTWQCVDHRILSDDTYATLSDDYAILTLHFPAYSATLRFRRK